MVQGLLRCGPEPSMVEERSGCGKSGGCVLKLLRGLYEE